VLHIVLVEDNPADAHMFRTALAQTGASIDVVSLTDGTDAVEYFSDDNVDDVLRNCDLVLLDLNLPRISGFEVLEHIKASEHLKRLPVIVMSGSSDPAEIERCYHIGANSYICKPTHLEEIFDTAVQFIAYWSHCAKLPCKREVQVH
jgi:CheY-like chemotaxis protein